MRVRIVVASVLTAMLAACAVATTSGRDAATEPASVQSAATQSPAGTTRPAVVKVPGAGELLAKAKEEVEEATTQPSGPRVAYIDLGASITEKPADFSLISTQQSTTLRSLLERLEKARADKDIQGVLVTIGGGAPNFSQAIELRDALLALKRAGKRTFVYADAYDGPSYILASGASDVCLLGGGEIELPGVGLEVMFAKGLLDKIGIEADYEQIGEYKGADEEFIHTQPSPEMSGELNRLVDALYGQLIDNISRDRHLDPVAVRQIVDQALIPAAQAKKAGLVDHLVDVDGLRDLMAEELGGKVDLIHDYGQGATQAVDLSNPFSFFQLLTKRQASSDRQAVALIYAEGVIVDGATADSLFSQSDQIGSDDLRQALRIAERDDQIGAVVIRIDSPGGSALASEAMWQAVRRVAKVKPVVVSVGSMAASGGYYLATSAPTIYADPTAIVGSIGVVGGKFVYSGLFSKLGLSTATFSRGANAALFSSDTPWTPQQRQMVHDWMKETYDQFTQRVMTTRKGKIKEIDKVARADFLAEQAKDLGLVDDIGGVNDAILEAAKKGEMAPGTYDVRVIPGPKNLADFFTGGPDARTPISPDMISRAASAYGGDSLLSLLDPNDRALLQQQITELKVLAARPVALVCPYAISAR